MSASVELDAYTAEMHALSLAPAMQVALGDDAPATALTTAASAAVAAVGVPAESGVADVTSYTLTCGPHAELRLHWGELQAWLGRS